MNIINRNDMVEKLNEYAFNNNIQPVIECLNVLLENKQQYQTNLDLIFIAIASTQMYGFLSYLTDDEQQLFFECDYFRSNSYRGIEIPFYNRGQLSFLYELNDNQKVFFSAPTSFGKTSIVTEYILNSTDNLNNVVLIVPTNSLLEELFEKFTLYNSKLELNYNISTQPVYPLTGRNILFLTPERFMIVAESRMINNFDLIVMDETYKIVDAHNETISDFVNHRALRFRKVADLIAKSNSKVVFLSPFTYSLTKSMSDFLTKHNIKKIDRQLEYVKRQIVKLDSSDDAKKYFGERLTFYRRNSSLTQKAKLILSKLRSSSSIIYVPNYSKAYELAKSIDFSCLNKNDDPRYLAFIKHIKENYLVTNRESWIVYDALCNGVGIYISPLPRYIKKEIIKLYEQKVLTTLIVTSAFTEGVNTCASNLIFTSLVNGPNTNKLSDIDVLNVSGRAGRFAKNTIGRIFCVNNDIYNRVIELQNTSDVKLENYNYKKGLQRLDFEIEMMDDEYLSDAQKEELKMQQFEIEKMGLSKSDLNISLNVSNNWKIILYKHFTKLSCEQIEEIYKRITDIFEQKEGECINALDYIFKDLRDAFINAQINVFPQEPYEISPFDKSGDFTWGRLYQIYVSGSPKKIISNNINFISYKFSKITGNNHYSNKREVESLFESNNAKWILRYYNNDLSLNMNAFYAETFKIVSNIIQYKIPFYLTFYVSIFKLFMKKRSTNKISGSDFDINRLINIFEDGETSEEYSKLLDYGIPITTITKISNNKISIENLKKRNYDSKIFDEYEKIIIEETINLL